MDTIKKRTTTKLDSKKTTTNKKTKINQTVIFKEDNKLYTEEYLIHHGAILGNKKEFIVFFLRRFLNSKLLYKGEQNMEGLAEFIYRMKILFIHHPDGFRRMKYSSILYILRANHKKEYEEWEKHQSHTNKVTK